MHKSSLECFTCLYQSNRTRTVNEQYQETSHYCLPYAECRSETKSSPMKMNYEES